MSAWSGWFLFASACEVATFLTIGGWLILKGETMSSAVLDLVEYVQLLLVIAFSIGAVVWFFGLLAGVTP